MTKMTISKVKTNNMINFKQYDKENPHIYDLFKKYTFEAIEKGFSHYSAKGIFEQIRWHTKTRGKDTFKVNNNFHADYGRKFMEEFENYKGFFRTRKLKQGRVK